MISAQAHVLVAASGREQRVDAERRLDLAIARASHLIQQLLDLAHIDASQAEAGAGTVRDRELSLDAPDALALALEAHAFVSIFAKSDWQRAALCAGWRSGGGRAEP